ncbi:hypothetical protein ACET3Z_025152 [Daucus carota]
MCLLKEVVEEHRALKKLQNAARGGPGSKRWGKFARKTLQQSWNSYYTRTGSDEVHNLGVGTALSMLKFYKSGTGFDPPKMVW